MLDRLVGEDRRGVYLDGGCTIQGFLRAGLVDGITLTRVPVLLGAGLPLFGPLGGDTRPAHVETRVHDGGLVQSRYRVEAAPVG